MADLGAASDWFNHGSQARSMRPKARNQHLKGLHDQLRKGGFSVNVNTGEHPSSGYAVSDYGAEESHAAGAKGSTVGQRAASYVERHAEALAVPGKVLGGWRSREQGRQRDYFDVSTVHPSSPAGHTAARLGALVNNQRAYYDMQTDTEPTNPSFEPDKGAQGRRIKRMSGENVTGRGPRKLPRTAS